MKGHGVTLSADSRGGVHLFTLCVSSILLFLLTCPVFAVEKKEVSEPTLSSIFPLGGQRGTTVEVEFRGKLIAGAYAVWPKSDGLVAEVKNVEEVKESARQDEMKAVAPAGEGEGPKLPDYRVLVQLDIGPSVPVGVHRLRLVSPAGVSNPMEFRVVDHPVVIEGDGPHQTALESQPADLPIVIHGRLAKPGEVDYYSFSASEGQQLSIKIVRAHGFDGRLALYQPKGSWLDPSRPRRLLLDEDRSFDLMRPKTEGTYRVAQTGRYAVEVSSLFGAGSPDAAYELQVVAEGEPPLSKEESERHWSAAQGSSFDRKVSADWMAVLQSRAAEEAEEPPSSGSGPAVAAGRVPSPGEETIEAPAVSSEPIYLSETEPNDMTDGALPISVPTVIEGVIGRPGDIDIFRFQAEPGQRLAFEIETPEAKPPHFNPRISVVDSQDHELFTNLYRKRSLYNNNADEQVYFKSVRPKVIYSFKGGEYFLQVRDVTSRYGNPRYAYRLLVRPQIPHVGEVSLEKGSSGFDAGRTLPDRIDRINLVRGEAKKLTIFTPHEEGFTGDVSFSVTGLPPGVEALAAAEVNDEKAPTEIPVDPELILPKTQETTIVLLAGDEAPLTRIPSTMRLQCRPIVNGKPGSTLLVRDLPLMVVEKPLRTKGETAAL